MPAVTADTLTLPRISGPGLGDTERPVKQISTGPRGYEGEGFPVVRAFAGVSLRDLDPFVHMDQMGEIDYAPEEPKGTAWHPHRGFETVTYMIDGTFQHQDSHGGGGVINNGATQWMTAGAGILHIETPPEELVMSGGLFHGLQLWVNLPAKDKFSAPRYQAIEGEQAALVTSADGGALVRIVAGVIDAHRGPGSTHTPITMAHATIQPGAQLSLPWQPDYNALVYVLSGNGTVGAEQRPIRGGQLAVFGDSRKSGSVGDSRKSGSVGDSRKSGSVGDSRESGSVGDSRKSGSVGDSRKSGSVGANDRLTVAADPGQDSNRPALEVVLLGGRPINEPVAHYGPFVMNTREELMQALEDYEAGRLGVIPDNALMPHTR